MPLVLIGADQSLKLLNAPATEMFGSGMEGRHYFSVLRQPAILDAISRVYSSKERQEARYSAKDHAQETLYRVICAPVQNGSGLGVLVSLEDVTSFETAGQMRRDFVANVSHELRTPLTAILGFIETLRGPARNDVEARDRFLETMEREAERMNRLVDDLLSLSRVETEERVRPTQLQDLQDLVQAVCHSLRPLAESAGVEVVINAPLPEAQKRVQGDADQLMQVFTNLIENAIKYGSSGGRIEIDIVLVPRDPIMRAPGLQVDVRDFGAGIDSIHLHRLTERFYRADNHRSRDLGGTGLGLAIVKHIANRHRGRLKIASDLGKGSCFSIVLPISGP
ncbi:two-component sensor histidine kinase [Pseudoruegeria sp. SK021]|nr:two-component sensor histidine kinase [Pseudoruegeria sp. SK021]